MSHQTGIHCNEELRSFISKCKTQSNSSQIRLLKISIRSEELTLDEYKEPADDWQEDYQRFVKRMVLVSEPCYVLFRLDSKDANGTYEWLFILWTPEESSVRQKMLYASTKATLKMEFGGGNILYDYFATTFDEISFNGFTSWVKSRKAADEQPLTSKEQELKLVRRDEAISSCITKTNKTLPGLEFPIDDEAINALFDLKDENLSYVQLSIDIDNEQIKLDNKKANNEFDVKNVRSLIPDNSARYHLIVFPHTFDGQFTKSIIFVYSIPGSSCSVKQRMLYSSCKSALLNAITDRIGIQIDKRLEIDNPRELTVDFLLEELHPKVDIVKSKFEKPKGPQGKRGAKRLIKSNGDE